MFNIVVFFFNVFGIQFYLGLNSKYNTGNNFYTINYNVII